MTKKVVTVYGILFLFAFTFALSFTLASSAQAEQPPDVCCIIIPCESNPEYPDLQGHETKFFGCVHDGTSTCDIVGICPNPGP